MGFESLFHAYGPALDTPGHLAALRDGDEAAREEALEHLWSAVIHQGTPWPATPPAALAVAELLGDSSLDGQEHAGLRASLLRFLAEVVQAYRPEEADWLAALANPPGREVDGEIAALLAAGDEELIWEDNVLGDAMCARAALGCLGVAPRVLETATALLADPDPRVRTAAAHAATACCLAMGETLRQREGLGQRLAGLAADAGGPDERAAMVLCLGELGLEPRQYLADPHPGVRACAALAPALADDASATAEILAALEDPLACQGWFTEPLPFKPGLIRFWLVAAAIERVDEFERLLPAALAVARVAGKYTVNSDWGRLLQAAFPGPEPVSGPLPAAQRRYLRALVGNEELWDPRYGNASLMFRDAGVPYDREACRALTATEPDGGEPA